jgi:hypothetical protein
MFGIQDPRSGIRQKFIQDPRSRILGVKKHRIPDPDPQHWAPPFYYVEKCDENYVALPPLASQHCVFLWDSLTTFWGSFLWFHRIIHTLLHDTEHTVFILFKKFVFVHKFNLFEFRRGDLYLWANPCYGNTCSYFCSSVAESAVSMS